MHQPQPIPAPTSPVLDWHRQKLAFLVAVHLGLTCLSQAVLSRGHSSTNWPNLWDQVTTVRL